MESCHILQPRDSLGGIRTRVRQRYDESPGDHQDRISVEQVRSAMNVWLDCADLPPSARRERFEAEQEKQQYYQRRNRQARLSHTKTRLAGLRKLGIDLNDISKRSIFPC